MSRREVVVRDSENDVRRRVREGDREAFALLYEQFARAVYNHGLRLTGDWSTAEEIMSETFLTAWRTRARVHEDGGSLLPWLLGIATHKADNARRGSRRRQLFLARQPRPRVEEDFAPRTIGRIATHGTCVPCRLRWDGCGVRSGRYWPCACGPAWTTSRRPKRWASPSERYGPACRVPARSSLTSRKKTGNHQPPAER